MKKYLCLTNKCLEDYEKLEEQVHYLVYKAYLPEKEIDKQLEELRKNFEVKIDKEQFMKQVMLLNGMLIKFSEYLSNPEGFKE